MWIEALSSSLRPVDVALALRERVGLAWLDAGAGGGGEGRFSYVTCAPRALTRIVLGSPEALDTVEVCAGRTPDHGQGPLTPAEVPAQIGYITYGAWEGRGPPRPLLWLARYDAVYVWDHVRRAAFIAGDDEASCQRLRMQIVDGHHGVPRARCGTPLVPPRDAHRAAIRRALDHIADGDIYQVNLARRWVAPFEGDPLALWLHMRTASPVPLGMFLDAGDHAVLASTMERFLRWDRASGRLVSRPIKGTIPRSGLRDAADASTLVEDPKERAEHAMIVDLVRNDLGRIATVGSVRVEQLLEVEPYEQLSHLVSTVACRTPIDRPPRLSALLAATFPPGSVTGAPKVRATELIAALEPVPRGVYTGAVGFIDRAGGLSWAVAIRTAQARAGEVHYHAGGGLVEASDPDREVAETELKARVFLDAVRALSQGTRLKTPQRSEAVVG